LQVSLSGQLKHTGKKDQKKKHISRRWQDSNLRPRRELISSQSH
jgi:hypothetical protein